MRESTTKLQSLPKVLENLCQFCLFCDLKEKEKEKERERLVILGMLININEQSSLASIFRNEGVVVNRFIEA